MSKKNTSHFGTLLLVVAFFAVLTIVMMIFGARLGFWEPIVGFGYFRNYYNPIVFSLLGLSILGLIYQLLTDNRKGAIKSLIVVFLGLGLATPMLYGIFQPTKRAPAIHDITTDTVNPPEFLVLDSTRSGAKNSLVYAGESVATIQQKAYPYIKPIYSNLSAMNAYTKALGVAKSKGWKIVAEDPKAFRFEATAQTSFFGFKDDVVVEVTPISNESRIDIRSVSRVGRSDQGVNAARIVEFVEAFNE